VTREIGRRSYITRDRRTEGQSFNTNSPLIYYNLGPLQPVTLARAKWLGLSESLSPPEYLPPRKIEEGGQKCDD